MKKPRLESITSLIVLPLLSLGLAVAAGEVEEIGEQPVRVDFPSGGSLKLDLCSSGAKIVGVEKDEIRVAYGSTEDKDLSKVTVRVKTSGSKGTVEVEHCPNDNFRITVEVPRTVELYVRMTAGQLDVKGITGSKDLELSAGQLNVEVGRVEDYASVDGSVTTGEVDAPVYNVNKGGLFRSFERKGPGRYRLHAHVGAGQLTMH
jgi:hypothetical protein